MVEFDFTKCSWAETIRTPRLTIRECPKCGEEMEIFSTDIETKCTCGHIERRKLEERIIWCAWNCPYADECLDEELYRDITRSHARINQAVGYFKKGYSCASAVVRTYADRFGIDGDLALKIPSVFAAGMGISETCGAVTGALMLIGAKYGKTDSEDKGADIAAAEHANRFINEFRSRNKYLSCRDLLGCDVSRPEVMQQAMDTLLFIRICVKLVRDAAEIIEQNYK